MPAPRFDNILDKLNSTLSEDENGCWICNLVDSSTGYGKFQFYGERFYAHRVAWEMENGPIPEGLMVLHRCDNPPCCNPKHLFIGIQMDNVADMFKKGRANTARGENAGKARLTEDNVREIRRLLKEYSFNYIANLFGVTSSTITNIATGRGWRHVK